MESGILALRLNPGKGSFASQGHGRQLGDRKTYEVDLRRVGELLFGIGTLGRIFKENHG
jgi:hypothetical protein